MKDLRFDYQDGLATVKCHVTGICIGTYIKEVNGSWRYFQDDIDYPLDAPSLRAIAEYLEHLDRLQ